MQDISFTYATEPTIAVLDRDGNSVSADSVEVHFYGQSTQMAYPVLVEAYVDRLLDRTEFREHCDLYQTRSAILRNLK